MILSPLQPQPVQAPTVRQAASDSATLSSDFETFLRMLTAQARYQDPLEPLDSSQYATQLAQFSMVEQQVLANDRLEALTAAMTTGNVAALAGWIGMEARAVAPVSWDGAPIELTVPVAAGADTATLVIQNSRGAEVARRALPLTDGPTTWDGRDDAGSVLPYGIYTLSVESSALGSVLGTEPAEVYGRIIEAQVVDGRTIVVLEGGVRVPAEGVTALRAVQ